MNNKTPFPQANNLDLIFNVFKDIGRDGLSKLDVSKKYEVDERQGAYYLDSLLYLGLVEKINTKYFLNNAGYDIKTQPQDLMYKKFCQHIKNNEYICKLFDALKCVSEDNYSKIISNMLIEDLDMTKSTALRRSSTVIRWYKEINEVVKEG